MRITLSCSRRSKIVGNCVSMLIIRELDPRFFLSTSRQDSKLFIHIVLTTSFIDYRQTFPHDRCVWRTICDDLTVDLLYCLLKSPYPSDAQEHNKNGLCMTLIDKNPLCWGKKRLNKWTTCAQIMWIYHWRPKKRSRKKGQTVELVSSLHWNRTRRLWEVKTFPPLS